MAMDSRQLAFDVVTTVTRCLAYTVAMAGFAFGILVLAFAIDSLS
jgi:hypothetical protein